VWFRRSFLAHACHFQKISRAFAFGFAGDRFLITWATTVFNIKVNYLFQFVRILTFLQIIFCVTKKKNPKALHKFERQPNKCKR